MKNIIKIAILSLILVIFTSCKIFTKTITKEVLKIDSTEVVSLKQQLSVKENKLTSLSSQLKESEIKVLSYIEKLNISEYDKSILRDQFETTIKEYNDKGVLIKETYSKKTSELLKDLTSYKEQNKQLTDSIKSLSEQYSLYFDNYNLQVDLNNEQLKQISLLKSEISLLKSKKIQNGFSFQWLLIGMILGLVITILLTLYGKRILIFLKALLNFS